MRQHTFGVLITFDASAREANLLRCADGTPTSVVVQAGCGRYLPATICCQGSPSPQGIAHAVLRIHLMEGEAKTLFDPSQAFTVWADAIVSDEDIRGEGLPASGVVLSQEPALPTTATSQETARSADHRPLPYRPTVVSHRRRTAVPTVADRQ